MPHYKTSDAISFTRLQRTIFKRRKTIEWVFIYELYRSAGF